MVDLVVLQSVSYIAGAIGVAIAAIFYVLNLKINQRNQELMLKSQEQSVKAQQQTLETRQAQLFLQLYDTYHDKDWVAALHNAIYYTDFKDFDDWWENFGPSNPEKFQSFDCLSHTFEGAGILVRRGLIDPSLVDDLVSEEFLGYWEKFGPLIKEIRKKDNNPHICENQEHLYDLLKQKHPDKLVFR